MKPKVETCTCLHYIGDNPPCPVHNDPENPASRYVPPRLSAQAGMTEDETRQTTPKSQAPA
jgi:hypothetical protein